MNGPVSGRRAPAHEPAGEVPLPRRRVIVADTQRFAGTKSVDAEVLAGTGWSYQHDPGEVEDIDLMALTPGQDLNWLEDIHLLEEDGVPAVFDRYSNCFLKIYFSIPLGREDEYARKVLMKHLIAGNSYGIQLKEIHAKFPQPELGSWIEGSPMVGVDYRAPKLEGWERPAGH